MAVGAPNLAYTRTLSDFVLSIDPSQLPPDIALETARVVLGAARCGS